MKHFIDNGDGTVTDTKTGLMWTKATVARGKTYKQGEALCKKLDVGGHKDWRYPTDVEEFGLADRSRYSPAIDTDMFPDTANKLYWTSTECMWAPSCVWVVYFDLGSASSLPRYGRACVRAVRAVPAGQ